MFTQFLGTAATIYGVLGALKSLLQTRRMLACGTSGDVSAGFLASYVGGYAIWLAYGLSTGSVPLIVVDATGLLCGGLTLAVALSLRGSLFRPATWNTHNMTSIPRGPQPRTRAASHPVSDLAGGGVMDGIGEVHVVDRAASGPAPREPVVMLRGLEKRYGSHQAVAGIDLRRGAHVAFF